MAATPDLSIVIPTYNGADTIWRAIASCLTQKVDAQIIVVDDGSTQPLPEALLKDIRECGVEIILRPENGGVVEAVNTGFDAALGEWCIELEDDDWFEPDCLEKMLIALDGMDRQANYFAYGDTYQPVQGSTHRPGAWHPAINQGTHRTWYAIMWHRSWWQTCRYWRPEHTRHYYADWDFVRQLEARGVQGLYVPTTVLNYSYDPQNSRLNNQAAAYRGEIAQIIHERFD